MTWPEGCEALKRFDRFSAFLYLEIFRLTPAGPQSTAPQAGDGAQLPAAPEKLPRICKVFSRKCLI